MKKFLILSVLISFSLSLFAQKHSDIKMADPLRSSGMIYVVIATISIIFIGLAIYLFTIDKRLKKIEGEK